MEVRRRRPSPPGRESLATEHRSISNADFKPNKAYPIRLAPTRDDDEDLSFEKAPALRQGDRNISSRIDFTAYPGRALVQIVRAISSLLELDVDEYAVLRFPYKEFMEKKLWRQVVQAAKKAGWEKSADDERSETQAVKAEFSPIHADRKPAGRDDMLDQFGRIPCHDERSREQDVFELRVLQDELAFMTEDVPVWPNRV